MPSIPASRPQRLVSEPRLLVLALLAGAVGVLGIIAIVVTEDAWMVIATVVAMALVALRRHRSSNPHNSFEARCSPPRGSYDCSS